MSIELTEERGIAGLVFSFEAITRLVSARSAPHRRRERPPIDGERLKSQLAGATGSKNVRLTQEMFRPDPSGELSVDEAIADLARLMADIPPDSPRALKLAEIIRGLRGADDSTARQLRRLAGT